MGKNIAAEFGLLAGLCHHPDFLFQIQQFLSVDDFTIKAHRHFFIVLQRLILNSKDSIVITNASL